MDIISHRGYWIDSIEKNSLTAFTRSIYHGFGMETDLRDANSRLVISHDIPNGDELFIEDFASLNGIQELPLALNIKSDGLAKLVKNLINKYNLNKAFVFDMSIPDTLMHLRENNPVFTRLSEFESTPCFYNESMGVWLDAFLSDWYSKSTIDKILDDGKKICIVSPELHKRDYGFIWDLLLNYKQDDRVILCTDFPEKAKQFFKL